MRVDADRRGNTLVGLLVMITICGALAGGVVMSSLAEDRAAQADLAREKAFQLAEAGIDWGIAVVRRNNGHVPNPATEERDVGDLGSFRLLYTAGTANSLDDDGDGDVDEADEVDYIQLAATGATSQAQRSVRVALRRSVQVPEVEAAVQLNVTTPILDLKGNAFLVSGVDHHLDGSEDGSTAPKHGIASPAPIASLAAQVPVARQDQIQGAGGTPSISQVPPMALDELVEQAKSAASIRIPGGTHTGLALGTPTESGVIVAYADEDIHLSGSSEGAGILVVDGDLRISGAFTWRGLILVRGRVTMVGGGGTKRVIGGVIIGEEIESEVSTTEVEVTGTVDLLYSREAIRLATQSLVIMSVLSWSEIANP